MFPVEAMQATQPQSVKFTCRLKVLVLVVSCASTSTPKLGSHRNEHHEQPPVSAMDLERQVLQPKRSLPTSFQYLRNFRNHQRPSQPHRPHFWEPCRYK